MTKSNSHAKTLLEFPTDFLVKIFGKSDGTFEKNVIKTLKSFFPKFKKSQYTKRFSQNERYLALSVQLYIQDQEQLDSLYKALLKTKDVLIVL